ncbi:MAG: hypothetical protein HYT79_11390 [Elusimicrobia bacterium]|nr:hypothetical protein [Elusimicrobiota bacterium]
MKLVALDAEIFQGDAAHVQNGDGFNHDSYDGPGRDDFKGTDQECGVDEASVFRRARTLLESFGGGLGNALVVPRGLSLPELGKRALEFVLAAEMASEEALGMVYRLDPGKRKIGQRFLREGLAIELDGVSMVSGAPLVAIHIVNWMTHEFNIAGLNVSTRWDGVPSRHYGRKSVSPQGESWVYCRLETCQRAFEVELILGEKGGKKRNMMAKFYVEACPRGVFGND